MPILLKLRARDHLIKGYNFQGILKTWLELQPGRRKEFLKEILSLAKNF
jgi:hypothetical protein